MGELIGEQRKSPIITGVKLSEKEVKDLDGSITIPLDTLKELKRVGAEGVSVIITFKQ